MKKDYSISWVILLSSIALNLFSQSGVPHDIPKILQENSTFLFSNKDAYKLDYLAGEGKISKEILMHAEKLLDERDDRINILKRTILDYQQLESQLNSNINSLSSQIALKAEMLQSCERLNGVGESSIKSLEFKLKKEKIKNKWLKISTGGATILAGVLVRELLIRR